MSKTIESAVSLSSMDAEGFKHALHERREAIVESLARNDVSQAAELIRQINQIRDETLYREVGRLTRGLHNALRDFNLDIGRGVESEFQTELSGMSDARSRLNYVIRMTEDAANRTMDSVDASVPVLQGLIRESRGLSEEWAQQADAQADAQARGLANRTQQLLARVSGDGAGVTAHLNDILVAQGFQDLSGQVIERVITLVTEVETALVRLARLAANVEMVAGIVPAAAPDPREGERKPSADSNAWRGEGPQVRSGECDQVVSSQDDVDDLLSNLGF